MANTLGDMVVRIVGDMTGFNKSLTDTQKKMVAFGVNAAAIGTAVAVAAKAAAKAVTNFTDYGSAIFDASEKTGLSAKAIQEWKFIAEQSGTTLETITSSVALMTKGLKANEDIFKSLGIETKNANGTFKSTTEIFNDTIDKLSNMQDATERDQLAFKLLGRGAQDMIPILNAGGGALDAMRKEASDLGIVLSDDVIKNADMLGDNLDALKASLISTGNNLVSTLAPALIKISEGLKGLISGWNNLDKGSKTFLITLTALSVGIIPLISGFISLGKAITGVKSTIEVLQNSKALAKAVSGGWVTLAIAGVVALGVAFVALTRSAETSRKKLAEIERLKLGGSTEDAQASLKLLNAEYDKQKRILDSLLSVNLNYYTNPEIRKEKEAEIQRQTDNVALLSATIKSQISRIDGLRKTELGTTQLAAEEEKLKAIEAELESLRLDGLKNGQDIQEEQVDNVKELAELEEWFNNLVEQGQEDAIINAQEKAIALLEIDKKNKDDLADLDKWFNDLQEAGRQDALDKEKKAKDDLLKYSMDIYGSLATIVSNFSQGAITTQSEQQKEEIRLLNEKLNAGLISQEDYEKQKTAIEKAGRMEAYELELKAFQAQQAFALGRIAIETAIAVAKVWGQTGLGGLIAQALPIAAGALQTVAVLAQKPPTKPAFAMGGVVMPQPGGVESIVAEAGKAEAIIPLDRLDQMLARASGGQASGGMMSLVVNLDSKPLLSKIFDATKNKTVLISSGAVV